MSLFFCQHASIPLLRSSRLGCIISDCSEHRASQEFPGDGVCGYVRQWDGVDELDELQQASCRREGVGTVRFDRAQQVQGLWGQCGELIGHGTVDHGVCVVLVGEDVVLLATFDGRPHRQRLLSPHSAGAEVPHNPSDDPVVRRTDPVVVVDDHARQRGDVDPVCQALVDVRCEGRVEAVDSFDDDDGPVVHMRLHIRHVTLVLLEGEVWEQGLSRLQQFVEVVPEEFYVQRLQSFVVLVAVAVDRYELPGEVVVVQ